MQFTPPEGQHDHHQHTADQDGARRQHEDALTVAAFDEQAQQGRCGCSRRYLHNTDYLGQAAGRVVGYVFLRMMEGLAAAGADSKTVMIDATYLKAHRTASSLRVKKGISGGLSAAPKAG